MLATVPIPIFVGVLMPTVEGEESRGWVGLGWNWIELNGLIHIYYGLCGSGQLDPCQVRDEICWPVLKMGWIQVGLNRRRPLTTPPEPFATSRSEQQEILTDLDLGIDFLLSYFPLSISLSSCLQEWSWRPSPNLMRGWFLALSYPGSCMDEVEDREWWCWHVSVFFFFFPPPPSTFFVLFCFYFFLFSGYASLVCVWVEFH